MIFICYALLLVLFYKKKLIRLNKANRTTFLSTNIAEHSSLEKIFHQMDILREIEMNEKLAMNEYEEFVKNIKRRNY